MLAAFRLWAVIDYFYPYKDLMGEDWDDVLRQFIVRMEGAKDALDYHLVVAEMSTHIHDSHAYITNPFLDKYFGEASAPVRIRVIEGLPVITGFTNAEDAQRAGLENRRRDHKSRWRRRWPANGRAVEIHFAFHTAIRNVLVSGE